jgi:hypothetical protein
MYKMHGTYIKISDVAFNLGKYILLHMCYAGQPDVSPTFLLYNLHAYCSEYLVCSAKRQTALPITQAAKSHCRVASHFEQLWVVQERKI